MPSTGFTDPISSANDNSAGAAPWSNTANAQSEDGTPASCNLISPQVSNYLCVFFNLTLSGHPVPSGATVTGIAFRSRRDGGGVTRDNALRAIKGGVVSATNLSSAAVWPVSDPGPSTYETFGADGILWGESWTPGDVNAADFGFAMAGECTSGMVVADVDIIQANVWYTTADERRGVAVVARRPDVQTDPQFSE